PHQLDSLFAHRAARLRRTSSRRSCSTERRTIVPTVDPRSRSTSATIAAACASRFTEPYWQAAPTRSDASGCSRLTFLTKACSADRRRFAAVVTRSFSATRSKTVGIFFTSASSERDVVDVGLRRRTRRRGVRLSGLLFRLLQVRRLHVHSRVPV